MHLGLLPGLFSSLATAASPGPPWPRRAGRCELGQHIDCILCVRAPLLTSPFPLFLGEICGKGREVLGGVWGGSGEVCPRPGLAVVVLAVGLSALTPVAPSRCFRVPSIPLSSNSRKEETGRAWPWAR